MTSPGPKYQLYAKPNWFDCYGSESAPKGNDGKAVHNNRQYVPPTTDIRPLEQTMYIPVIPTKPGGEREVTFPMTPRTLGQPDVTTACCVPVLPCQPGFRNLTPHIKPTAAEICRQGNFCSGESELAHHTCQHGGALQCCDGGHVAPPNNIPGDAFVGVPDTFPAIGMRQELPKSPFAVPRPPPSSGIPHLYTNGQPQSPGQTGQWSSSNEHRVGQAGPPSEEQQRLPPGRGYPGQEECGGVCKPHSALKNNVVAARGCEDRQETAEEREIRLTTMFGSYGSCMQIRPKPKRISSLANNITEQGNGFHWERPINDNNLCYIMAKQS